MGELKKEVKKYGKTLIISFSKEDIKVYKIKKGNIIKILIDGEKK